MKIKDVGFALVATIALLALWMFLDEKDKGRRKDLIIETLNRERNILRSRYIQLLEQFILSQTKHSPDVVIELQKLKSDFDRIDIETHREIDSVIKRLSEGEGTKAVRDLAKIVEVKLKDKVAKDVSFTNRPYLHHLLEHAHKKNWISNAQFENGLLLKDLRNKESHELGVDELNRSIGICLFGGIDIIYAIK